VVRPVWNKLQGKGLEKKNLKGRFYPAPLEKDMMTEDVVGKAMRLRLNPINASQNLVQAFQALRRHTLYGVLLAYLSVELTFHIH
jgi:hypothetical protein